MCVCVVCTLFSFCCYINIVFIMFRLKFFCQIYLLDSVIALSRFIIVVVLCYFVVTCRFFCSCRSLASVQFVLI